jgi:transposase InsO family protein
MCSKELTNDMVIEDCDIKTFCEVCAQGKLTRMKFPKQSSSKSTAPLDLIHTDVCGPMQTVSPSGMRYVLTFIDDFTRYTVIYLLKQKSEVEIKLKEYIEMVKTMFGRKPKVIRSDRGGEYIGKRVIGMLKSEGIRVQYTAPYTPQQNGVAERKNRTLIEMARCMLLEAGLPYSFWAETVNTANYIQNRSPSRSVDKTPHELWTGSKPGSRST